MPSNDTHFLGKETNAEAWNETLSLDDMMLKEIPKLKTNIRHLLNIMMSDTRTGSM